MKNKNIKQEKGITLIALVITIIVLLILAGVAISMLSGENGILTRAIEAKERTEEAQKEEEIDLIDMEVEIDFSTQNTPYKFKNGYLTNINVEEAVIETVKSAENNLPEGYIICNIDGSDITQKETTNVGTGMILKKGNKIMGRIIIFGDINCDGNINESDATRLYRLCDSLDENEEYQIVASDVNHDGKVDKDDVRKVLEVSTKYNLNAITQNVYAYALKEIKVISEVEFQQDIIDNKLPEDFRKSYKLQYNEEKNRWIMTVPVETTAIEILTKLGEEYNKESYIVVRNSGSENNEINIIDTPEATDIVKENDRLMIECKTTTIKCYIVLE